MSENRLKLDDKQKKGLVDLPNCELTINYACKPTIINPENNKISKPIKRGIVKKRSSAYNLNKIIEFLNRGFNKEELFRICMQRSDDEFYNHYLELKEEVLTKLIIVQKIVEFAERKGIIDILLIRAKKINTNKYDEYAPFELEDEFSKEKYKNPDV